jgi:hypothetical protein
MTDIPEDPELTNIYPVEMSMSGKNAHYQFCEAIGQSSSYAVCLHRMAKIADGSIANDDRTECQRAYCHNTCPSKKMRAEELKAGQALYFKPRIEYKVEPKTTQKDGAVSSGKYDMSNASYARGWAIGGREGYSTDATIVRNKRKPTRNIGPITKSGFIEESMADLVNVLMKEKPAEVVIKPKLEKPTEAATPARPLPGESIADFVKRRAAEKNK